MVSGRQVGVLILVAIVGLVVVNYAPLGSDNGATENGNALTVTRQLPSTAAPNSSVRVTLQYTNPYEDIDIRETVQETGEINRLTLNSGNGTVSYQITAPATNNTVRNINGNIIGYDTEIQGDKTFRTKEFGVISPPPFTPPDNLASLLPDSVRGEERTDLNSFAGGRRVAARYGSRIRATITQYRTSEDAAEALNEEVRNLYETKTNNVNRTNISGIPAFVVADIINRVRWVQGPVLYEITAPNPTNIAPNFISK